MGRCSRPTARYGKTAAGGEAVVCGVMRARRWRTRLLTEYRTFFEPPYRAEVITPGARARRAINGMNAYEL